MKQKATSEFCLKDYKNQHDWVSKGVILPISDPRVDFGVVGYEYETVLEVLRCNQCGKGKLRLIRILGLEVEKK